MDRTDTIREGLKVLFDEMLVRGREFKRKSYAGVMEDARQRYKDTLDAVIRCYDETPEEERAALTEELAPVIPEYAYEKMQAVKKRNRDRTYVDYNMNMAVYVIPLLNDSKHEGCVALTQRIVELWNEKGITNMHLMHSTYEEIAAGFERKLCYITTAACRNMGKADDCEELQAFRDFRDKYLMETEEGRGLVAEYYETAPGLVMLIDMQRDAKEIYEGIYKDYLSPCLDFIREGKKDACREHYVSMMRGLENKYLYAQEER